MSKAKEEYYNYIKDIKNGEIFESIPNIYTKYIIELEKEIEELKKILATVEDQYGFMMKDDYREFILKVVYHDK